MFMIGKNILHVYDVKEVNDQVKVPTRITYLIGPWEM